MVKIPHQCVKCGALYSDASEAILKGCSDCESKLFFYVKKDDLERVRNRTSNLTSTEKKQIEKDVYDIIGDDIDRELPVVLDIESINILKPGKYELDLVNLFKKKQPLIYKLEEGKYVVDINQSFDSLREK